MCRSDESSQVAVRPSHGRAYHIRLLFAYDESWLRREVNDLRPGTVTSTGPWLFTTRNRTSTKSSPQAAYEIDDFTTVPRSRPG